MSSLSQEQINVDLFDEVKKLQQENERLREQQKQLMDDYRNDLEVLDEHAHFISKLRVERANLREALEFYADETKYEKIKNYDGGTELYIERDCGEKARQALGLEGNS